MKRETNILRLIYPQWQGGVISSWMPDIAPHDASRGYHLGSQLLKMLAPQNGQREVEVPITLDIESHEIENGISGYRAIIDQSSAALSILNNENPDRIVTLGGECSVSVIPFTYLAKKYGPEEVATIWIDAHADLNKPFDSYTGYHAMALAASFGVCDSAIVDLLPAFLNHSKSLLVGLRTWGNGNASLERQREFGVEHISSEEANQSSSKIIEWIVRSKTSKVLIHFDLDALDPKEMVAGVADDPDGLTIEAVIRIINDIAAKYDIVGLTIAEPMPRIAIKIRNMLSKISILSV